MSEPRRPDDVEGAVREVRAGIERACRRAGRSSEDVVLVAAGKGVPIALLERAAAAGVRDFGENYAAELEAKSQLVPGTWHFLGKLQRGTASKVARHAQVVHSAEPGHGLERLARRARATGQGLPCLVQVDFAGRRQGVPPEELEAFVAHASGLEGILLAGLMTLPPWTADPEAARPYFARLRALRDRLSRTHPSLTELSMGMSADYPVAVEEGATMVRVGTALFGERSRTGGAADATAREAG